MADDADNDNDNDRLAPPQRVFAALHALHRSLARNFQPVIDALWSPPLVPLGRRQDPVEQERTEVDEQDRAEERQREGEKRVGRSRARSSAARRNRRKGGAGFDDSSDPSETGDESASGSPGASEGERRTRRPTRERSGGSGGTGGTGDVGEASLSAPAREAGRGTAPARDLGLEDDAGEMRADESDPDEVDEDRELEQGMHEVEDMAQWAKQGA